MKKISFVATLIISGVISTSSLAQNYYDSGYFQSENQGYANYGYSQNYNYPQNYGYQQNYGYYPQQTSQYSQSQKTPKNKSKVANQSQNAKSRRGIGTVSIGADYVLGYFKFESNEHNLGELISGGGDYTFDTNEFERRNNSVALSFGWRPFKYIGIEAYYLTSLKETKNDNFWSKTSYTEFETSEQEVSYKSYGIDLLGYFQINDYIDFIASIGVGKYDVEADVTVSARNVGVPPNIIRSESKKFEDSVTAYRIGGGFQVWLSNHISMRIMGRWIRLGGEFADYVTEVNAGVRYHF